MIRKPATVRLRTMTAGIAAIFAALLVLPAPSAFAAGDGRPMIQPMPSQMSAADARASRAARPDPRIAQFNREFAAYKQTVAALRRDEQRLVAQQSRLNALVNDLNQGGQMANIQLQNYEDERQKAMQTISNMLKALHDTENQIIHNMK